MSRAIPAHRQRLLDDLVPRILGRRDAMPITSAEIAAIIIDEDGRLPCTLVDVQRWLFDHPAFAQWTEDGWIARRISAIAEASA